MRKILAQYHRCISSNTWLFSGELWSPFCGAFSSNLGLFLPFRIGFQVSETHSLVTHTHTHTHTLEGNR